MIKIEVGDYRMAPYGGYKAWMIEKKHKDGRWRPYKYPGNRKQAIRGMLAILMVEAAHEETGDFKKVWENFESRFDKAVEALGTAISRVEAELEGGGGEETE